jgi:ubiquinone/menaquinone biosynthesis C-methylase UbiE
MQHWDSFWSTTKSLNSFAEGEHSQGYIGGIADFWQVEFSGFPKSASILDLATGNGGLAVLAQQYDSNFNISASDSASIDPLSRFSSSSKNYQLLKKISFFSNMNSESLTFLQDQFDRVISQFGFEYAKPELALSEINRVLKYNGEFIALVHHRDSLISIDCRIGLAILNKMNDLLSQLQEFGSLCQKIIYKNEPTAEQQIQFKDKNATLIRLFK